jgi:hypothetical protein
VTVSWFGPRNQVSFDLSVAPQNRRREVDVGHVSRSSGLLLRTNTVDVSCVFRVTESFLKLVVVIPGFYGKTKYSSYA